MCWCVNVLVWVWTKFNACVPVCDVLPWISRSKSEGRHQHLNTLTHHIPCFLILLYNAVLVMPSTRAVRLTLPSLASRDWRLNCFSISSSVNGLSGLGLVTGEPISSSAERITSPSLSITARSIVCCNSLMLPGQWYFSSRLMTPLSIFIPGRLYFLPYKRRK